MAVRFNNLARSKFDRKVDECVYDELKIAGIPILTLNGYINDEVKTHFIGVLNGFVFERAWSYWVVSGWMPMEHAKYIYANYKDLDIRAGGVAGGENPEKSHVYTDPAYEKRIAEFRDSFPSLSEYLKNINRVDKEIKENPEDPKFIKTYHIDTQLGLCKFAEVIKRFDIHTEFLG